jgi:hypothetical protein
MQIVKDENMDMTDADAVAICRSLDQFCHQHRKKANGEAPVVLL